MAAVQKESVWIAKSLTGNTDGTERFRPEEKQVDFLALIRCSALGGGTTATIKLQDSADGSTWFDWISFTALTGTGNELKAATRPPMSYVKPTASFSGGTTTATISIDVLWDRRD